MFPTSIIVTFLPGIDIGTMIIIAAIIGIHGLIHFMGFMKSFNLAEISQLTQPISKIWGICWAFIGLLLCISAVTYGMEMKTWSIWTAIGILGSQTLIIRFWKDAKYGSIANILIAALLVWNAFFIP